MQPRIIILHGPNLNLLGEREPDIYGDQPFEDFLHQLRTEFSELHIEYYQSNHEGKLIDWLHGFGFMVQGIVINAGAYSHTSIALRDAVSAVSSPVAEVHISDLSKRESFRHQSYLTEVCAFSISGEGYDGYRKAVQFLADQS